MEKDPRADGPEASAADVVPDSFRALIGDIASGMRSVHDLRASLIHDGVSDPAAADLVGPLMEAMPRLDGAELVGAVDLIWELTVDPVVRSTLGTRAGADVEFAPAAQSPAAHKAMAARAALVPHLEFIVGLLDHRLTAVRSAAAVALSAQYEAGVRVAGALARAARGADLDSAPGRQMLLAAAVLAGSVDRPIPLLPDWFESVLSHGPHGTDAQVIAAIGLRNSTWPVEPSSLVLSTLVNAVNAPSLALKPWITQDVPVKTLGLLLLDWPRSHVALTGEALSGLDEESRVDAIAESWRRMRRWRMHGDESINQLARALSDTEFVAEAATVRLAWSGEAGRAASDALLAVLAGEASSRRMRAEALRALGRYGDGRSLAFLLPELRQPVLLADVRPVVGGMRAHAAECVYAIGEYLESDAARSVPARTVSVLTAISGWPESATVLSSIARYLDDDQAAAAAAGALGALEDAAVSEVEHLHELVRSASSPSTVAAAVWALWSITHEWGQVSTTMQAMLRGSPAEQVEAARWIFRCGAAAADLAPDLLLLQASGNEQGRVYAARALAATSDDSLVDRSVLTSAIGARRHIDLVLSACEVSRRVATDLEPALRRIAYEDVRITWPRVYDGAIVDDEEHRARARRILG